MRVVLQRVKEARVEVAGKVTGLIGIGLVVLLGIAKTDSRRDADYLIEKIVNLRVFPDDSGKMNRCIKEIRGSLLIVSQFTLYGECRRGRRPSFDLAASPLEAAALYDYFLGKARDTEVPVEAGTFQASMQVYLVNDGPVTIICESVPLAGTQRSDLTER